MPESEPPQIQIDLYRIVIKGASRDLFRVVTPDGLPNELVTEAELRTLLRGLKAGASIAGGTIRIGEMEIPREPTKTFSFPRKDADESNISPLDLDGAERRSW